MRCSLPSSPTRVLVVVCGLLGNPQQQQQLGAPTKPLALRPLAACCTVDIQQVLDTPLAVLILDEFLRGKGGGAVEALNFWKGARKFRLTFKAGGPAATCVTPLMACSLCVYLLQPHSLRTLLFSLCFMWSTGTAVRQRRSLTSSCVVMCLSWRQRQCTCVCVRALTLLCQRRLTPNCLLALLCLACRSTALCALVDTTENAITAHSFDGAMA